MDVIYIKETNFNLTLAKHKFKINNDSVEEMINHITRHKNFKRTVKSFGKINCIEIVQNERPTKIYKESFLFTYQT